VAVQDERRQYNRLALDAPEACSLGDLSGFVFNVSVTGALVFCAGRVETLRTGEMRTLEFSWEGHSLSFECEIIHTDVEIRDTKSGRKLVTRVGCNFVSGSGDSTQTLRTIIAQRIERALDEQRANARGVPALLPTSTQRGTKDRGYVRYRLRGNEWTREATTEAEQPRDGFTIGADEREDHVALLCESYRTADFEGRRLIRRMAELSISRSEGVPTRRYEP